MSIATPNDMKLRYDARRLGDLVKDDGTRETVSGLDTNTVMLTTLEDAESYLFSKVLRGDRYLVSDLQALTSNDKNLLVYLECAVAFGNLLSRRGLLLRDMMATHPELQRAEEIIQKLSEGEEIFNISSARDAGHSKNVVLDAQQTLVTGFAARYFGNLDYIG